MLKEINKKINYLTILLSYLVFFLTSLAVGAVLGIVMEIFFNKMHILPSDYSIPILIITSIAVAFISYFSAKFYLKRKPEHKKENLIAFYLLIAFVELLPNIIFYKNLDTNSTIALLAYLGSVLAGFLYVYFQ